MNTDTYPDLIETLSFLKFPDEKHLLYFSEESNSDSESFDKTKPDTENSVDLFLSCSFPEKDNIYNNVFTETLSNSSKSKTIKSKKSSSKKSSSKKRSIKKSSIKSASKKGTRSIKSASKKGSRSIKSKSGSKKRSIKKGSKGYRK